VQRRDPEELTIIRRYKGAHLHGSVFHGDGLGFLRRIGSTTADIVFLDPPFNLGKRYSNLRPDLDKKPERHYERWLKTVLDEGIRVLRPGGALYVYHLPVWAVRVGAYLQRHLTFQHWIAVSMKNGFVRGRRLYPAHYALLMFTKGSPRVFRRPRIPLETCRHCDGYVKDYGGYLPLVEGRGLNLSDVWDDLSPVRHANRKHRQANELPQAFFQRVVEISGIRGGMFVDPFSGSGTGIVVATRHGMHFAGCDLILENCQVIIDRLGIERKVRTWHKQ
jgi:site-specific DNA-methyltransferase (adenine-specific)